MATVTIRDLDDKLVKALKARAKTNHRSLEAELRARLARSIEHDIKRQRFIAAADRIAAMTPNVPQTDSALLIREDRDR